MPEDTLEQISAKRASFERLHSGHNWLNLKIASDCYVAAFFSEKTGGVPGPADLGSPHDSFDRSCLGGGTRSDDLSPHL